MKIFAQTNRLILREILPSDLEGMYELDSDPEVHRYLGNKPLSSKTQVEEIIHKVRQQYIDHGIGRWAVVDKTTNDFMGWAGLKFVTEPVNKHINFYDLGYRIIKKYWGKGIGTEAAIASLEYGFETLQLKEIYAAADCDNTASNKILRNLGLNFIETFYYEDIKCNWYLAKRP